MDELYNLLWELENEGFCEVERIDDHTFGLAKVDEQGERTAAWVLKARQA